MGSKSYSGSNGKYILNRTCDLVIHVLQSDCTGLCVKDKDSGKTSSSGIARRFL